MHSIAEKISKEAYILGIRQTYAPNLDLAREPRWGRVEETFGEDPYLISQMGVAYVKGLQSGGVAATLKHYAAHGSPESGLNISPVHIGERELREVMLEPFEACIKAGAMSVMPAYNELDGIPLHCSYFMLDTVLRKELKFDGLTVSDYGGIMMLESLHKVADNPLKAGLLAIDAGVDIEAPEPYGYGEDFRTQVKCGKIPMEKIDAAVRRILTAKFKLGLFEYPWSQPEKFSMLRGEQALSLARQAAEESIVLLKNNKVLPLSDKAVVALVGPNAFTAQLGDYTDSSASQRAVSLYDALAEKIGKDKVKYANGCNISDASKGQMEAAIAASSAADVIVVALGDNSSFFGGVGWGDSGGMGAVTCGEGFDISSLELPLVQKKLLRSMLDLGKPVVTVIYSGRPYCLDEELKSDALLMAWYPGEMGGYAVADIITGQVCPSGRLPVSIARSAGHLPCYYNYKVSARGFYKNSGNLQSPGRDYVFDSPKALFPFGFGLSYTKFEYSDIRAHAIECGSSVKVSVNVINAGKMPAAESILLYVSAKYMPVSPFVKRLRAFKKVFFQPGQQQTIELELDSDSFCFVGEDMKKHNHPGEYILSCGSLSCKIVIPDGLIT